MQPEFQIMICQKERPLLVLCLLLHSTAGSPVYLLRVLWVKSAGQHKALMCIVDAFCQALTFQIPAECLFLASKRKDLTFHSCFSTSAE